MHATHTAVDASGLLPSVRRNLTMTEFIQCGNTLISRSDITAVFSNGDLVQERGGAVLLRSGERLPLLPEELAALWQALTAVPKRTRRNNL